ncbi:TetR family transcriptional regulator [Nocardioides pantholopis]|uniref:TetR family transcriptional regulator n=1 Tax=Nocardioides pantholopis TaxID=2483798 RepID=UPI000F073A4E|nr:TetR family transcriptional regulator [Nocardioides pantholopis]
MASTRDRIVEAAFTLFEERGFEETTVDDVAERAGVGRTTFFRAFGSKEDVIFPDHARLLAAVSDRLATGTAGTALVAVTEASRIVLQHYLAEGTRARTRYRLTRSVPALRAREIAGQLQYQRAFRTYLHAWMGGTPATALRAELMANVVVTAHNHVLRSWLRGETTSPAEAEADFDRAMAEAVAVLDPGPGGLGSPSGTGADTAVVVLRTTRPLEELLPELRAVTERPGRISPEEKG